MLAKMYLSPIIGCLLLAALGCGPGSKLKTVPVSGNVTYKGAPVEGAMVAFLHEVEVQTATHTAIGKTDSQGVYKLMTFETPAKPLDGAAPGKYMVTVTKTSDAPPGAMMAAGMDRDKIKDMSPQDRAKMSAQSSGVPTPGKTGTSESIEALQPKSEVPKRYGNPNESKLVAEVTASGPQTFNFELTEN